MPKNKRPRNWIVVTCPTCRGSGKRGSRICPLCKGEGIVVIPPPDS